MQTVTAQYYDGTSSRQQSVTLIIRDKQLEIHNNSDIGEKLLLRSVPQHSIKLSAKLGNTPRMLQLPEGGHCEVHDNQALDAMLQQAGLKHRSFASWLESSWHIAVAATALTVFIAVAGYLWGLPLMADNASRRIPDYLTQKLDVQIMETIDAHFMKPGKTAVSRQKALQARMNRLYRSAGLPERSITFRNSEVLGANAFALPGGTIVMTDQLVNLAKNDEEIIAVLAHELGHVAERHPLRQLLQSSVVSLALAWYIGDISSQLAAAPTLLLETNYSRNFERRADLYAARLLESNGIRASRLADILEKLEAAHTDKKPKEKSQSSIADIFSTHPDTAERIRTMRSFKPN